jgi:hypothetical protein
MHTSQNRAVGAHQPSKENTAMVGNVPGILPKTALVGSRVVNYPFTIPKQMNESATKTGAALNGMVAGINGSIGNAYVSLEPKGPAKWLIPLFAKVDQATQRSEAIAQRNKAVFWDPFSNGMAGIGQALGGPGAYYYLKKAGVEQPTADQIAGVLNMPLFSFPTAGGSGGSSAPQQQMTPEEAAQIEAAIAQAQAQAQAQAGAQGAAEGAGQVAA